MVGNTQAAAALSHSKSFWSKDGFALTRSTFQSSSRTFFMGKCGAWPLQNLVTMVKSSRAKGSSVCTGKPGERGAGAGQGWVRDGAGMGHPHASPKEGHRELWGSLSSILKVSLQVCHSGGSVSCSTRMFSTIRYMTLSRTLPAQHSTAHRTAVRPLCPQGCPSALPGQGVPELRAVGQGDGRLPQGTAAGLAVPAGQGPGQSLQPQPHPRKGLGMPQRGRDTWDTSQEEEEDGGRNVERSVRRMGRKKMKRRKVKRRSRKMERRRMRTKMMKRRMRRKEMKRRRRR